MGAHEFLTQPAFMLDYPISSMISLPASHCMKVLTWAPSS
jgi:hypothetical protein